MKILFIQPPALMALDSNSTITQPPLGIAYLAAYARQSGHEVSVVDAVGEEIETIRPWPHWKKRRLQGLSFDEIAERVPADTDVLAVSCMFTHAWPMVRELLKVLRRAFPEKKLIVGGEHVTGMFETVLREAPVDLCVLGEGEITLGEVLDVFRGKNPDYSEIEGIAYRNDSGEIVATKRRKRVMNPDDLPWPAWDLLNPRVYFENKMYIGPTSGRSMPLLSTRGCPYRCSFCSASNMWSQLWRPRDPASVADEIESYMETYQANDFQFQDLTAIVRKDWIIAFCNEIRKRKLDITWQLPVGTRSEAIDAEVAETLVASGCHQITYAPESASKRILSVIRKKVRLERLEESARGSLKAGMTVCLFTILGFPQEELSDIRKTMKWLRHMARMGVQEAYVSTFVPLPGTELFREMNKTSRMVIDDEYCYWMTGATSFFAVRSWNPLFSDSRLRFFKLFAFLQFYLVSYLYHPRRIWRRIRNLCLNKQETKVDRAIQEFIRKIPLTLGLSRTGKSSR